MTEPSDQIPWDEIREYLFSGQRIAAIKAYREASGADLKASKEFIEELETRLREEFPDHFKASARAGGKAGGKAGCAGLMLIALVIGAFATLVLFGMAYVFLF